MKYLTYQLQTVVKELGANGVETERYIYSTVIVPDNENGRELAEREAYNGEYTTVDDGVMEEPVKPTDTERIAALEEQLAAAKILLGVE